VLTVWLRTLPVHEVVRHVHPRPPPEAKDHVAMAMGHAVDGTLSWFGHEMRTGRRPTVTSLLEFGGGLFDEALDAAGVDIAPAEREKLLEQLRGVIQAYRRTEIVGLARPRSHLIVINGRVGIYAQPDFWDGRGRVFEMKSFPAIPPPPDVALQLRLFQLAFPKFEMVLVCLNRHATPVETASMVIPPPSSEETLAVLCQAFDVALEFGEPKVLDYVQGPAVHYSLTMRPADASAGDAPASAKPTG
jgi:hypothetical protein